VHAQLLIWWQHSCSAVQARAQGLSLMAAPERQSGESPLPALFFIMAPISELALSCVSSRRRGKNSEP